MKKLSFLLATLIIGGMMLTGCKKSESTPEPEPTPVSTAYRVVYTVSNTNVLQTAFISDCFKVDVTYTDANGESVTVNGATLPWTKTVEVEAPFHAVMTGSLVFNEDELPDRVTVGVCKDLSVYKGESLISGSAGLTPGTIMDFTKTKFFEVLEHDPDFLKFTSEANIE